MSVHFFIHHRNAKHFCRILVLVCVCFFCFVFFITTTNLKLQSKLIAVCLIFFSDRGFYFCEYLGFICFSVFCDLKKKNLMRKLSYLCNLLLTVWSYIFFFQFKIYLTLFSFLIQIYIMYFVSLKHCAACFCYISF